MFVREPKRWEDVRGMCAAAVTPNLLAFRTNACVGVWDRKAKKKKKKSEGVNSAVLAAPNNVLFKACRGEE